MKKLIHMLSKVESNKLEISTNPIWPYGGLTSSLSPTYSWYIKQDKSCEIVQYRFHGFFGESQATQ